MRKFLATLHSELSGASKNLATWKQWMNEWMNKWIENLFKHKNNACYFLRSSCRYSNKFLYNVASFKWLLCPYYYWLKMHWFWLNVFFTPVTCTRESIMQMRNILQISPPPSRVPKNQTNFILLAVLQIP